MKNLPSKIFLVIILCSISKTSFEQVNLVPNFSFEIYDTCPNTDSQIGYANGWFQPTLGTPDYFNSCGLSSLVDVPNNYFGYQYGNGNAYAGFFITYPWEPSAPPDSVVYREYIETKLMDSLLAGVKYYVCMYLSLSDSSRYTSDDIGVLFSNDTTKNDTSYLLNYSPQINNSSGNYLSDKNGWMKISGSFIAQGGEKFITIGNFKSNASTDTIPISGGGSGAIAEYYTAYLYVDDICVSTDSATCNGPLSVNMVNYNTMISVYPNPSFGEFIIDAKNIPITSFWISNYLGKQVLFQSDNDNKTIFFIDLNHEAEGMYFLYLKTETNIITRKLFLTNH